MMNKSAMINTRINPALKQEAEQILAEVGLSSAEAIRLFYRQICLHNGLPFVVRIPNEITRQALQDAEARNTHSADSSEAIFDD